MYDKKAIDKNKWMIDPDDAVMLLVDHQSGLFQTVADLSGGIARKPLNVPQRKAAGDEQVEEHRPADHEDEFGAE